MLQSPMTCAIDLSLMKTCMNINATSWPTVTTAKAARHDGVVRGRVFGLCLSMSYSAQKPEINWDGPGVSR
jgi:hypothetical protein